MKEEIKKLWYEYEKMCREKGRVTSIQSFLEWIVGKDLPHNTMIENKYFILGMTVGFFFGVLIAKIVFNIQ